MSRHNTKKPEIRLRCVSETTFKVLDRLKAELKCDSYTGVLTHLLEKHYVNTEQIKGLTEQRNTANRELQVLQKREVINNNIMRSIVAEISKAHNAIGTMGKELQKQVNKYGGTKRRAGRPAPATRKQKKVPPKKKGNR